MNTLITTLAALIAFAANSVLCRMALADNNADPGSFTVIRLASGAIALFVLAALSGANANRFNPQNGSGLSQTQMRSGSWLAAFMLFTYAVCFSFAYVTLETGTGALILFGSVQMTMISIGFFTGNRLRPLERLGILLAFSGFVYLVWPSIATPSLTGFVLMTLSGIAWGFYSILGKGSIQPMRDTTFNFVRTLPLVVILAIFFWDRFEINTQGVMLAVLSGAIASGVGYSIWYIVLRVLNTTTAAVSQLAVPIIAAVGGVIFVSEPITLSLIIASAGVLGGILLVVLGRKPA